MKDEMSPEEREAVRQFEREKALLWEAMNRYHDEQWAKRIVEAATLEADRKTVVWFLQKGYSVKDIAEYSKLPIEEIERLREEQGT